MLPSAASSSARLPILMSALVYPGTGQFMQKRWVAGGLFALSFTVAFGKFLWEICRIFAAYFGQVLAAAPTDVAPGYAGMLAACGAALILYTASLVDTILAQQREARRRHVPPPLPPV